MKIIGNPDRFALGFDLVEDPDAGGQPHSRASWGHFQVWVSGRNLTSGRAPDGTGVDSAMVPLAPIVKWIAQQWDPMFHEGRLPTSTESATAAAWSLDALASLPEDDAQLDARLKARADWWGRHGLGAALPDFRVPDLHIRRVNSGIELSWDDREWRSVPGGIRLNEMPGAAVLPASEAAEVVHGWATAVVEALDEVTESAEFAKEMGALLEGHANSASPLERLGWASGEGLKRAAREVGALAAGSTVDHEDMLGALLGLSKNESGGLITPLTVPAMLFKAANPALSTKDIRMLAQVFAQLPSESNVPLSQYQRAEPPPARLGAVTQDGYDKAVALRAALKIDVASPLMGQLDLEKVVVPKLGVTVEELTLDDFQIDGVAMLSAGKRPMVAVNVSGRFSSTRWGRRMTLAHELCHLLHDLSDNNEVGMVSNPWAPYVLERRANAFAAMLLMPPAALADVLCRDSRQWTSEMLHAAMKTLGVGRSAFTWHLYNLKWIGVSERRAWLDVL